ncbi:uncharacterized protein DUF3793 [Mobilisporobacter senegalensis]|uniref:Uncharacterized protein DUF3793 n=1 Tax=Mobilisporobacter senegalensis TaxID=1329262 RepID=A0A3N1XNP8_9FIRM|nr:DUF3793 family protein [Mobilisporobacter senegalensis]ROR26357.1 uncharacterized protein DUF3793 [Mobilisporobacter senegalensis]
MYLNGYSLGSTNNKELNMKIARQCAPLLTGIKISNLLITSVDYKENIYGLFEGSVISMKFLAGIDERNTFLLYKQEDLVKYINEPQIQNYLIYAGYESMELEYILEEFASRYSTYLKEKGDFPHELGLLLGYPVEDVIGFIENEGRNFLYIGYWKVYSNLEEAIETFKKYNYAKEIVTSLVSQGVSIQRILNEYHLNPLRNRNQLVAVS